MNPNFRKLFATSALAIGLVGGGAAIATAATDTSTQSTTAAAASDSTTTAAATTKPADCGGDHKADHAARDAALAKQLGVTTAQLDTARTAARDAVDAKYGQPDHTQPRSAIGPTAAEQAEMKARHTLFESTLATKLGVSVEKLRAAEVAVEKTQLDAAVTAGRMTQTEADAILKAIQNGERPAFGGRGPGGRGPGGHGPRGFAPNASQSDASDSSTDA
jgi:hypothetical protein